MRVLKRGPWLAGLGVGLAMSFAVGGPAAADVRSDEPGSIVIYPKVIAEDGVRDTLIQLTNTSNLARGVHCYYINALGYCERNIDVSCQESAECPEFEADEECIAQWQELDFGLTLTRQQPTIWRVSTGRIVDPTDEADGSCAVIPGNPDVQTCPGIDPGQILPAIAQPFRGELRCIQVDDGGDPTGANSLKGEAVIQTIGSAEISMYNSINIQAADGGLNVNGDDALNLNNTEYNACPSRIEVIHPANLVTDALTAEVSPDACDDFGICLGGPAEGDPAGPPFQGSECDDDGDCAAGAVCQRCPIRTEITIVPCTALVEDQVATTTTANFSVYNDQEISESASEEVTCWFNEELMDIGDQGVVFRPDRGEYLKTAIRPSTQTRCIAGTLINATGCDEDADCGAGGVCGPSSGILAIVETFHESDDTLDGPLAAATAAVNVHYVGGRRGFCRVGGSVCDDDADCIAANAGTNDGRCRDTGGFCDADTDCDTSTSALNTCDLCLMDRMEIPELVPQPRP
jgi:hypothetical protein